MSNIIVEVIESRSKREELLNNSKSLMLVENYKHIETINKSTDYLTSKQVADYFEVDYDCIKKVILRHKEELIKNGLQSLSGTETKDFLGRDTLSPQNVKGGFIIGNFKFNNKLNYLINRRCLLNIAMLLTESKVAEKIRGILLDITENVLDNNIIETDINKEQLIKTLNEKDKVINELIKTNNELIKTSSELINQLTKQIQTDSNNDNNIIIAKDKIEQEILNLTYDFISIREFCKFINEKGRIPKKIGVHIVYQLYRDNDIFNKFNRPTMLSEGYFLDVEKGILTKQGMIETYRLAKKDITNAFYQLRR